MITPGAGGYGNPKKYPAEKVLQDVTQGKVSLPAVKDQYGVVIYVDGICYSINAQATAAIRLTRKEGQNL